MIKVLQSGFYTSVQDLGRFGFGNIGVPNSGAMDQFSSKLANQIVGNNENDAVLEITQGNCSFLFQVKSVICITGADCNPKLNTTRITLNTAIQVVENDILTFKNPIYGVRTYVAVAGGLQTESILNSRSYFNGITPSVRIKKNDLLSISEINTINNQTFATVKINSTHFEVKTIKVFKGPEYELLSNAQKKLLLKHLFTISNDNDRMGYRLKELISNELESILTSAVLPGTVQLTPSGKLIVLMRDCQVTGGYPRVLQLTDTAINQMAQKTTGSTFVFQLIDLDVNF